MKILPELIEIKRLRKKLDISQKELGKKLNISQCTISRIENGTVDPPYSKVKKIIEFLEAQRMLKKSSKKNAENIMTKDIISIKSKSTIQDAVNLMNKYKISQLPILENGQNLGSITSKKIQKIIIDNPELIKASVMHVKELPFPEVEKNWNVKDISSLLINYPAVLVKEDKRYIGIITDSNFLRLTSK